MLNISEKLSDWFTKINYYFVILEIKPFSNTKLKCMNSVVL